MAEYQLERGGVGHAMVYVGHKGEEKVTQNL